MYLPVYVMCRIDQLFVFAAVSKSVLLDYNCLLAIYTSVLSFCSLLEGAILPFCGLSSLV